MATYYYITATAPATLLVSGRRMQLLSGDSRGPFSEVELQQIMSGPDRRRLVATAHHSADQNPPPKVVPTPVDGMGLRVGQGDEKQKAEVPQSGLSYEESKSPPSLETAEPVKVTISDVNEPLTSAEKDAVESSVTEVLPQTPVEDEPAFTSKTTALDSQSDEVEKEVISRSRRRKAQPPKPAE